MGFCDDIREIRQKCFLSQEALQKNWGCRLPQSTDGNPAKRNPHIRQ